MKPLDAFHRDQPACWLLSFDFDGTLVDADAKPPIDPRFFELIRNLRDSHRVFWGVNTGRSLMHTIEGIQQAEFPFLPDYLIVREREIHTPDEFARWIPDSSWNKSSEEAHAHLFRKHRCLLEGMKKWVESETAAVWGLQVGDPEGIVASTASEMDGIVEYIDTQICSIPELSYQRNGIYLRFSHVEFHKGTAMLEVARKIGVGTENTFAIGDSHNDLDMLDLGLASVIACPANACAEVKTHVRNQGGYVSESSTSSGAIEALSAMFYERENHK